MAQSVNKILLVGNIGKDAEVRQTTQGVPYAHFTLATSTGGYKRQDGTEVPKQTEWHSITCWRNLATMAGKYCKKGVCVVVTGALHYGKYTDKQNVERTTVEVIADTISIPNGKAVFGGTTAQQQPQPNNYPPAQNNGGYGQQSGYGGYQQQGGYNPQPQAQAQPVQQSNVNDDLPF